VYAFQVTDGHRDSWTNRRTASSHKGRPAFVSRVLITDLLTRKVDIICKLKMLPNSNNFISWNPKQIENRMNCNRTAAQIVSENRIYRSRRQLEPREFWGEEVVQTSRRWDVLESDYLTTHRRRHRDLPLVAAAVQQSNQPWQMTTRTSDWLHSVVKWWPESPSRR